MNRILISLMVPSLPLFAADPKTVEAVKATDRAWAAATVQGDAAALKNLLADDLTYTHSNGETDTKAVFMAISAALENTTRSISSRSTPASIWIRMPLW
jgi:ketosteroid isomerase-like protein